MKIKFLLAVCFITSMGYAQDAIDTKIARTQVPKIIRAIRNEKGNVISIKNQSGMIEKKTFLVNTNGTYSLQTNASVITPGQFADIKFGDIDGDGTLDVIFTGNNSTGIGNGIALNNGSGVFTRSSLDVSSASTSCGFADFDNNGLIDYYVIGNGIVNNGAIFFQNQDGSFTKDQSAFSGLTIIDADITIVDFNNDGFIDLFVTGWDENAQQGYSAILLNDGKGKFTVMDQPNLIQKGYGSSVWGDVDGDGWLDLLLNGDGGANGEISSDIYRLYKNNHGVLEPKTVFNDYRQLSIGDGARMVDWDNDGKLDVILTGWSNTKAREVTELFTGTNSANFTFTESPLSDTDFPGVSKSSIETADLNNDGRIDLMITGFNGNESNQVGKYNRNICGYYLNQTPMMNAKPLAPGNLAQIVSGTGDQNTVSFSWSAAMDDKTPQASLTYNLSLLNITTGKWLYNPMAVNFGSNNGWRKVAALGNVFTNRKWVLNGLPTGTYQWTAQAIDANFVGGTFANTKTFTIAPTDITEISSKISFGTFNGELIVNNNSGNPLDITVYSVSGSLITQLNGTGVLSIPLKQGIYIVKAKIGQQMLIKKIII
jgi:uncharacterized protein (DUF2141 family)